MTTPSILVGHIATRQIVVLSLKKKKEGDWISGRKFVLFYSRQQRNKKKTSVKDVLKKEKKIKLCLCDHTVDY